MLNCEGGSRSLQASNEQLSNPTTTLLNRAGNSGHDRGKARSITVACLTSRWRQAKIARVVHVQYGLQSWCLHGRLRRLIAPWSDTRTMPPRRFRTTISQVESRVTLITSDSLAVKAELGASEAGSSDTFTSLRRTTRSSTSTASTAVDLASYAFQPSTPSPRKRVKREPITPQAATDTDADVLVKLEEAGVVESLTPSRDTKPPTPKSSKKAMPQLALEKPHPEPAKWRKQYRLLERMRKGIIAPVDTM